MIHTHTHSTKSKSCKHTTKSNGVKKSLKTQSNTENFLWKTTTTQKYKMYQQQELTEQTDRQVTHTVLPTCYARDNNKDITMRINNNNNNNTAA